MNCNRYTITEMCCFFCVSRSGYYAYVKRMAQSDRNATLVEMIREQQKKCDKSYGYRHIWKWLKNNMHIYRNPKTILRIIKKHDLLSKVRHRRKWRQMGQQIHKYDD